MANKKFSEFELKTTTSNVSHIVGYNGAENVRITPANFLDTTGGPYLPLAGGTMTGTGNVTFPDNFRLYLGTSLDLQIYHDGSNSWVRDTGAGNLFIDSNGTGVSIISDGSGSTPMAHFYKDGAVELYHNNVKKFETTSSGISVTGNGDFSGNVTIGDGTSGEIPLTFNSSATDFALGANGSNFMIGTSSDLDAGNLITLSSSGNFGVGTSSPTAKIDVRNDVAGIYAYFGGSTDGGARGLVFSSADNGAFLGAVHNINASSGSGILTFSTGGIEKMRLDASGKLGVGTTTPVEKLTVFGQICSTSSNVTSSTAGTNRAIMDLSVGGARMGHFRGTTTAGNGYLALYTDSVERMRINSSGTATFVGTASANIIISRDNMFVGTGQLYIGAENGTTDDTYRQVVGSGIYKIESRESGTWTNRFQIDSSGNSTFSGSITATGGVYLGGTAAANKLDDYKEDTFIPEIFYQNATDQANVSYSTQDGFYTKVGNLVTCEVFIVFNQASGTPANDNIGIKNLPYTGIGSGAATMFFAKGQTQPYVLMCPTGNTALIFDYNYSGNQGNEIGNSSQTFRISFSYTTTQ